MGREDRAKPYLLPLKEREKLGKAGGKGVNRDLTNWRFKDGRADTTVKA